MKYNQALVKGNAANDNEEKDEGVEFNAAKYFFVSHRLASTFPELKASQMILQFSTPWPKQSYKRVSSTKKAYDKRFTQLMNALS